MQLKISVNFQTYILFVVFFQFILCQLILFSFISSIPTPGDFCRVSWVTVNILFRDDAFILLFCLLSCYLSDLDDRITNKVEMLNTLTSVAIYKRVKEKNELKKQQ